MYPDDWQLAPALARASLPLYIFLLTSDADITAAVLIDAQRAFAQVFKGGMIARSADDPYMHSTGPACPVGAVL